MSQIVTRKLGYWLREIHRRGLPYLDRYSLRKPLPPELPGAPQRPSRGWCIYLHHLRATDVGPHHSHPWAWSVSIVLRGWYVEEWFRAGDSSCNTSGSDLLHMLRRRTVRWLNVLTKDKLHSIVQLSEGGCWTLFIAGPSWQRWGFWLPYRGVVPAQEYRAERLARGEQA